MNTKSKKCQLGNTLAIQERTLLHVFLFICRHMKTSSVSFSLMIIFGCILVFTIPIPVILTYGADQYHINEAGFSALCHVKLKFYTYPRIMCNLQQVLCFLDKIGFILVSIALLLKTWRLYQIQRNKLLRMKVAIAIDLMPWSMYFWISFRLDLFPAKKYS